MPRKYSLSNVEERAAIYRTFEIPSLPDRILCPVGSLVKLIFQPTAPGAPERMWVRVTTHKNEDPKGFFHGRLLNTPAQPMGLRKGSLVKFRPEHIAAFSEETEGKPS